MTSHHAIASLLMRSFTINSGTIGYAFATVSVRGPAIGFGIINNDLICSSTVQQAVSVGIFDFTFANWGEGITINILERISHKR